MHYCPYCSAPVSETAQTCHHCKRNLDFNAIADVLESGEGSLQNKAALRKIWIKEHAVYIWPFITLLSGFIAGGLILYLVALAQFSSEKDTLISQIDSLNAKISDINSNAKDAQSGLSEQLEAKDRIISVLNDQRVTLSRIINFTRRMSDNSIITANSTAEAATFRRNFRFLERQFNQQQDQLNATQFKDNQNFNLETLPQLLTE